jgi:hypothetical protein
MRLTLCAALLALVTTASASALTLNCSHTGGFQTTTINGKTETKRQDYPSTMSVDLDLARKTLAIETLGEYDIMSVTGVEIKAGETTPLGHSMIWTLNRVTGELRGDSTFNERLGQSYSLHTWQCERAAAKF